MVQRVKNLPTMQETWVLFLDQEDPREKGLESDSPGLELGVNDLSLPELQFPHL